METSSKNTYKKIALIFGLIYGLISVGLSILLYSLDKHLEKPTWSIIFIFLVGIGITFIAIFIYRKKLNGFISVEQAIKLGVAVSLIAGVIATISNEVYHSQIEEPEIKEERVANARKQLEETFPDSSEEEIEKGVATSDNFARPVSRVAFGTMWNVFTGLIYSLIAGLILQRQKPTLKQQGPLNH